MFEHDLEKIGNALSKHQEFWVLSQKFGGKNPKIGGVLTPETPAFWMYEWYFHMNHSDI